MTGEAFLNRERDLHRVAECSGTEVVWIWEASTYAVVLGRSSPVREVRVTACHSDGVPVLRRDSGGGTVLIGQGCLNYSVILNLEQRPYLRDVEESYRVILSSVASCLPHELGIRREGSDLTFHNRKFAGCSQRRLKRTVLHHGTLLYGFDLGAVARYLDEPERRPVYRARRTHAQFLTNVAIPVDFASRLYEQFPSAQAVS